MENFTETVPAPPPQKGGRGPKFSANFYCGQTAGCIKMPLGTEVGLDPCHIVLDRDVLDGDPAPPKRGTAPPQLSAHVYCGQTVGWIKMPLGMEVGLLHYLGKQEIRKLRLFA